MWKESALRHGSRQESPQHPSGQAGQVPPCPDSRVVWHGPEERAPPMVPGRVERGQAEAATRERRSWQLGCLGRSIPSAALGIKLRPYEESRGSALGADGNARLLAEIVAQAAGVDMELRNSMLDLVLVRRLRSSSMASTVESGLKTLRRTQTRLSSSGGSSNSSLRVPER